ncbi:MAG: SpoIID/LytB domain-containing protein, partial [Candidatus Omnitrophica bacterium]|nr:SpoIID/LytB domain-containing protein [Candidatus Omnitrophota bacterium]
QVSARLRSDKAGEDILLREGLHLSKSAVRASQQGILVGEQLLPSAHVRVEPARDATINLNGQRLRGTVDIYRQRNLTLLVINQISLEDYLLGVVAKEAPAYWPVEALKAIAIAARTYALSERLSNVTTDYDVTGTVLSQVYGGRTAERSRTTRAVKDTEGLVLTSHGRLFPAFYHSTCGGLTEHASVMGPFDLEPLQGGRQCSWCANSPFYRWRQRLTKEDLAWAVKQQGRGSIWPVTNLEVIEQTSTGRVAKIRIHGTRSVVLTGYEFRELFGFSRIRSTAFTVVRQGEEFMLEGQGWGHGVGLCQWGAAELAQRGFSAREILAFYYPHADLIRLGERPLQPVAGEPIKEKP